MKRIMNLLRIHNVIVFRFYLKRQAAKQTEPQFSVGFHINWEIVDMFFKH